MFTRRQALLGTAAAASFAAPVAMAEYLNRVDDDADLMQRARAFHQDYPTTLEARAAWTRAGKRSETMPDYPPLGAPRDVWFPFLEKYGVIALRDESHRCTERSVALAQAVFAIPAATLAGAIEKFRIARLAEDDPYLSESQNRDDPWMAGVLRDLERLAGRLA